MRDQTGPAVFAIICMSLLLPASASALVMCAKVRKATGEIREGTPIRLRTVCRDNEQQLDPETLGLTPGEQVLLDANGQLVGQVLEPPTGEERAVVVRDGVGLAASTLDLVGVGQLSPTAVELEYASSDCTGTPHLQQTTQTPNGFYATGLATQTTLYYAVGEASSFYRNSYQAVAVDGVVGPCQTASFRDFWFPVAEMDLTQFVAPFSIAIQ